MNAAGKWNVTMDTPIGTQKFVWDLQHANGQWKGMMTAPTGASEMTGIRINGNTVSFDTTVNSPMGAIHLAFSGDLAGNRINGKCRTMFGDSKFVGERA